MLQIYREFINLRLKSGKKAPIERLVAMMLIWIMISASAVAENDLSDPDQVVRVIENLNWITEEYPPFNYRDPNTGEITGVAVEVLLQIFTKLGVSSKNVDFKIYPWARGYHMVLNDPGTALFSTTYTVERLQKMKFVGPMAPNVVAVIAPKSSQLSIKSIEDLNRLKIGVVRDDIGEQLLISQGVKPESIDRLNSGISMVKKLASGRIDAVGYAHATTQLLFKTANINPDEFEVIQILKSSSMGYTFHKSTDARILEPIRKALDELIVDGTLAEIQARYGL
ncbi:MAG: polar amino acid transport system substrate-binding protein [Parasphingorhabdus sp.]|jgi:polar amino acid transport system substrate-binding protein